MMMVIMMMMIYCDIFLDFRWWPRKIQPEGIPRRRMITRARARCLHYDDDEQNHFPLGLEGISQSTTTTTTKQ
jgi:hypothetical protein